MAWDSNKFSLGAAEAAHWELAVSRAGAGWDEVGEESGDRLHVVRVSYSYILNKHKHI